jgi:hypothetical protein
MKYSCISDSAMIQRERVGGHHRTSQVIRGRCRILPGTRSAAKMRLTPNKHLRPRATTSTSITIDRSSLAESFTIALPVLATHSAAQRTTVAPSQPARALRRPYRPASVPCKHVCVGVGLQGQARRPWHSWRLEGGGTRGSRLCEWLRG